MKITLKDGSVKEYNEAKSVYDIALDISEGLARAACAGEVNGEIVDLRTVVEEDATLNILTANDPEGLKVVCPSQTEINISGIDKQLVGEFAANVRKVRKPEPYKGKGIRYSDEIIRRKEGQKAK